MVGVEPRALNRPGHPRTGAAMQQGRGRLRRAGGSMRNRAGAAILTAAAVPAA